MDKMIELPNGSWVRPSQVNKALVFEARDCCGSELPPNVTVKMKDGTFHIIECATNEGAKAIARDIAKRVNCAYEEQQEPEFDMPEWLKGRL